MYLLEYSTTATLVVVLLYLLYQYLTRNFNYWQSKGVACENPTLFVGNFWEVFSGKTQVGKFFGQNYAKYKEQPYFGLYILDKPYLVLRNPKIIKKILIRDFNNFSDRIFACDKNADPMAGNSVFLLKNPRWRAVRSKLTSIFTSSKLKLMFPTMRNGGVALENYLTKFDGEKLDVKEVSAKYTTDVTALCFFGFHPNSFENENTVFRKVGRKLFDFNVLRTSINMFAYFFLPWAVSLFKLTFTDFESTIFMRELFRQTIDERIRLGIKRNDFVDLLLSLGEINKDSIYNFDEDTMVSQAITFYIAGFESTSNLICFTLYQLALHPDIQQRLKEEVKNAIPLEEGITVENIHSLKYLDMVLAETLRCYPFAPFLNRKCKADYVIEDTGFTIEKGTKIIIPTDGLHFDPEFYPEPEKFIPERFGPEVKFTSDTYYPFGGGPRFCIGDRFSLLAAKISIYYCLRRFTFEKCEDTPDPVILNPRSPFLMSDMGLPLKIIQD